MKTITFNTSKELKQSTRIGFGYTPQFSLLNVAKVNGIELTIGLDVTNTSVSTYNSDKGTIQFAAPYILTLKN